MNVRIILILNKKLGQSKDNKVLFKWKQTEFYIVVDTVCISMLSLLGKIEQRLQKQLDGKNNYCINNSWHGLHPG